MQKNPHSELVSQVLITIGSLPNVRVWKNSTGMAQTMSGNVIQFGLRGSPDILGIIKGGIFLGIECKTGSGVQSKVQKNFQVMIKSFGGIYILARHVDAAVDELKLEISKRG